MISLSLLKEKIIHYPSLILSMTNNERLYIQNRCLTCGVQDKMFDCESCYCLTYCSEQHKEEDRERHSSSCRNLRISRVADTYEVRYLSGVLI